MITSEQIHDASNISLLNISNNWPKLAFVMSEANHMDPLEQIGMIATVCVETNITVGHTNYGFCPIKEEGDDAYFTKHYEYNKVLGNLYPGDGAKFCGRGLIQTTGRGNYVKAGLFLGLDLITNPDLLFDIDNASKVAVQYFTERKIWAACLAKDWDLVRHKVNGGSNGIEILKSVVNNLLKVA